MAMRTLHALAVSAALAAAVVAIPREAQAEEVTPTAKGIVGTALLGGEVVVFAEAIFGVRSPAAYLIGAGAGAVAGGVGGYFIEQAVDDGRIPAYLLAGGLALMIPAIVVALDATRYMPAEGAREDKPVNAPPSDPGKPGGSSVVGAEAPAAAPATTPPASSTPTGTPASGTTPGGTTQPAGGTTPGGGGGGGGQAPVRAPVSSLFDVHGGNLRVGMPVPDFRPIMGANERTKMGVANQGNEVRFPVVKVAF
jgi:hypothetical protein